MTAVALPGSARDSLENALDALGCPNPRAVANLVMEVLPDVLESLTGARLTAIRGERYGPPNENFTRIGTIWSAIFGHPVSPEQVGLAMLGVKLARLIESPADEDSLHDLAGYAATLEMLAGRDPSV